MIACFIGHRKIVDADTIKTKIYDVVCDLIDRGVDTYLFGSKSEFDDLCWRAVTDLKEKHRYISRIYVRAEYPKANSAYEYYLHEYYESTLISERVSRAGKSAYVERNLEMIDSSDICVFYYCNGYVPDVNRSGNKMLPERRAVSGTAIAFKYALQKGKTIINIYDI